MFALSFLWGVMCKGEEIPSMLVQLTSAYTCVYIYMYICIFELKLVPTQTASGIGAPVQIFA